MEHLPGEVEGLKHLHEGEVFAVPEDDDLVGLLAQLALDEAQQMLLMHAGTVMNMCVYLQTDRDVWHI